MMDMSHTDKFAKAASLYLAESLRTRRVTRQRAAEIAEKILAHLNLMDTETHFLRLVKELARDFQELKGLEAELESKRGRDEAREFEATVRAYAIDALHGDYQEALALLKAAGEPGFSKASILALHPNFKSYYLQRHGK